MFCPGRHVYIVNEEYFLHVDFMGIYYVPENNLNAGGVKGKFQILALTERALLPREAQSHEGF